MSKVARVQSLLNDDGLLVRGFMNFENDAPRMANGEIAASVMLIGHGGASHWTRFSNWRTTVLHEGKNPLDDWSKHVIEPIANVCGGQAAFPSDEPFHPFQQWAMQAEGLKQSPLGMLIHPVFGLWHAYRGAIIFRHRIDEDVPKNVSHPCDTCSEKPCISVCPVNAFSKLGYDVANCRKHLKSGDGQACVEDGCLARRSCPIGREFQYTQNQMQFHMKAFAQ